MAADDGAIGLSRVRIYAIVSVTRPVNIPACSVLEHINTTDINTICKEWDECCSVKVFETSQSYCSEVVVFVVQRDRAYIIEK